MHMSDARADKPLASTEGEHPSSNGLDTLGTIRMLELMGLENEAAARAVGLALPELARAVDAAVSAIKGGGRVCYAGAGTSGRLGVLDASEMGPTFGVTHFIAVMAGGMKAITNPVEGAEDDEVAGRTEASMLLNPGDMAIGITASGRTPYVLAFLREARSRGCSAWLMACSAASYDFLDGAIILPTGPEIISGSTRLKAGTATKMALNMLSTATMVALGGTYDGLMVDVAPTNAKLIDRAERIIMRITRCDRAKAGEALKASGMRTKVAVMIAARGIDAKMAEARLEAAGGSLRIALED